MNTTFSIFVATTLLLASSSAEAARGAAASAHVGAGHFGGGHFMAAHGAAAGNRDAVIAPVPQISTAPPQTNPIGGVNQNFDPLAGSAQINPVTGQAFGALPGAPGSPTFDPNGALPNVNNPGSALAPLGSGISPTGQ